LKVVFDDSLRAHSSFKSIVSDVQKYYQNFDSKESAVLFYENGVLQLRSELFSTVSCDFNNKAFIKEVRQSYGRAEGVYSFLNPLAKKEKIRVCDMTVGMGKDFFKFILAGHKVRGFERNPVFYYLVSDGIDRFLKASETEELKKQFRISEFKIELLQGEAVFDSESDFDLVYYDPMFDDKSKKAAPKKGMQALKHLSRPAFDLEKEEFLQRALKTKSKSLVYKCSGVPKDFPFAVKKEHKGKGFSYVYL